MKNKNIVDYILVCEEAVTRSFNYRIKNTFINETEKLHRLYAELSEVTIKIHNYRLEIERRNGPESEKNTYYTEYSFDQSVKGISNEELENSINQSLLKEKELSLEIESLEKLINLVKQFKGDTLSKIERSTFEITIAKLTEQGYVPQGGVSISHGFSYQAMVKYED